MIKVRSNLWVDKWPPQGRGGHPELPPASSDSGVIFHATKRRGNLPRKSECLLGLLIRPVNSVKESHPFRKERGMDGAPRSQYLWAGSINIKVTDLTFVLLQKGYPSLPGRQ
jgi:hypothetical protein